MRLHSGSAPGRPGKRCSPTADAIGAGVCRKPRAWGAQRKQPVQRVPGLPLPRKTSVMLAHSGASVTPSHGHGFNNNMRPFVLCTHDHGSHAACPSVPSCCCVVLCCVVPKRLPPATLCGERCYIVLTVLIKEERERWWWWWWCTCGRRRERGSRGSGVPLGFN